MAETQQSNIGSYIRNTLFGISQTVRTCQSCGIIGQNYESFPTLGVFLPEGQQECSLQQCLQEIGKSKHVPDDECSSCQNKSVQHTFSLSRVPEILTIHLRRFGKDERDQGYRNNIKVNFDKTLDLSRVFTYASQHKHFQLVGIVNQMGTLESGHYTADCYSHHTNSWHKFNDDKVSQCSQREVELSSDEAYILYYQAVPTGSIEMQSEREACIPQLDGAYSSSETEDTAAEDPTAMSASHTSQVDHSASNLIMASDPTDVFRFVLHTLPDFKLEETPDGMTRFRRKWDHYLTLSGLKYLRTDGYVRADGLDDTARNGTDGTDGTAAGRKAELIWTCFVQTLPPKWFDHSARYEESRDVEAMLGDMERKFSSPGLQSQQTDGLLTMTQQNGEWLIDYGQRPRAAALQLQDNSRAAPPQQRTHGTSSVIAGPSKTIRSCNQCGGSFKGSWASNHLLAGHCTADYVCNTCHQPGHHAFQCYRTSRGSRRQRNRRMVHLHLEDTDMDNAASRASKSSKSPWHSTKMPCYQTQIQPALDIRKQAEDSNGNPPSPPSTNQDRGFDNKADSNMGPVHDGMQDGVLHSRAGGSTSAPSAKKKRPPAWFLPKWVQESLIQIGLGPRKRKSRKVER